MKNAAAIIGLSSISSSKLKFQVRFEVHFFDTDQEQASNIHLECFQVRLEPVQVQFCRAVIEFVRSRAMFQLGLFVSLELGAAATSNDGEKIGFDL